MGACHKDVPIVLERHCRGAEITRQTFGDWARGEGWIERTFHADRVLAQLQSIYEALLVGR